jgi:hypothetical protein
MEAFISIFVLVGCIVFAGWPLLALPRVRTALAGAVGSGCMGLGATVVGLIASGILQMQPLAAVVLAADNTPAITDAKSETPAAPAEKTSAPESGSASKDSAASSKDTVSPSPASDPAIDAERETLIIPPGRPQWIESEPSLTGSIHTVYVCSGPFALPSQANRALDDALVRATRDYVSGQLGDSLATRFIDYDAKSIKQRFVKPECVYREIITASVGPMHQVHALLQFDPEFRKELDSRWETVRATSRLFQMGLFSGAGLLLITSVFGYFRLDHATRGYYTGRLQFMTAAAILAVVGASAVVAQWIHWL